MNASTPGFGLIQDIDVRLTVELGRTDMALRDVLALGEESVALSLDVVPTDASALSSEFSFAAGVAAYGMLLRESPYKGEATYVMARELAEEGLEFDQYGYRADFVDVIKAAETIASKY